MIRYIKSEDTTAIVVGAFLLVLGLVTSIASLPDRFPEQIHQLKKARKAEADRAPFATIAYYRLEDEINELKDLSETPVSWLAWLTQKPGGWMYNPLTAFSKSPGKVAVDSSKLEFWYERALQAEKNAASYDFQNEQANQQAEMAIGQWREIRQSLGKLNTGESNIWSSVFVLFGFLALIFALPAVPSSRLMFIKAFSYVFILALLAYVLAGQANMKAIGFGYAAWAIVLGLVISNTIGTPTWVKPALQTELYIKTGLVLLGAEILLNKVMSIGLPGIFIAWIVTPIVLISTYWFGQRILKIPSKTLNITVSADMSVCGVSAAVATAAACKAKQEELVLAIGLSMVFTSVMMIVLPAVINVIGMPEVLGGAWVGGTIDSTGAVVAAGAFLGDTALQVAATIKMIQNILIGFIAFGVAAYFTSSKNGQSKVSWKEIWYRFPKFILGFLAASVVFTLLLEGLGPEMGSLVVEKGTIGSFTKNIRGWLFCLAFVSIGLSTHFKSLSHQLKGGKPLILYACGQTLNLILTLLMAYVMFYLVFPEITQSL